MMRLIHRVLSASLILALPLAVGADCMGPYPPSMIRAFNQNCNTDSQKAPFCTCIVDEIQKNIPLADFIEISNSTAGINGAPRFIRASAKCSPLLPNGNNSGKSPQPGAQQQSSPQAGQPAQGGSPQAVSPFAHPIH